MDPYIGIVVFELEANPMAAQPSFFREDFYIVYADTQEEAYARVERIAKEQEIPKDPDSDESQAVTVRHIVDVAPTLYDNIHEDCDLYSRHFASLSDYKRFEMKLGGLDPLTELCIPNHKAYSAANIHIVTLPHNKHNDKSPIKTQS